MDNVIEMIQELGCVLESKGISVKWQFKLFMNLGFIRKALRIGRVFRSVGLLATFSWI